MMLDGDDDKLLVEDLVGSSPTLDDFLFELSPDLSSPLLLDDWPPFDLSASPPLLTDDVTTRQESGNTPKEARETRKDPALSSRFGKWREPNPLISSSLITSQYLGSSTHKSEFKRPQAYIQGANDTLPRHQRASHLNAEKKRRKQIQVNLRNLQSTVPTLRPFKESKKLNELECLEATTAHIKELKIQIANLESELKQSRKDREDVKRNLINFQAALPDTGLASGDKSDQTLEDRYRFYRTASHIATWKFGLFDQIVGDHLAESYIKHTGQSKDPSNFLQSLMKWTGQRLCLSYLRPVVITGLGEVASKTSVLTNPGLLKEEISKLTGHLLPAPTSGLSAIPGTSTNSSATSFVDMRETEIHFSSKSRTLTGVHFPSRPRRWTTRRSASAPSKTVTTLFMEPESSDQVLILTQGSPASTHTPPSTHGPRTKQSSSKPPAASAHTEINLSPQTLISLSTPEETTPMEIDLTVDTEGSSSKKTVSVTTPAARTSAATPSPLVFDVTEDSPV